LIQQILGALLVVPLLGFAVAMDRRARLRRGSPVAWVLIAGCGVAVVELATNVLALAMASISDASANTMYTLTVASDLADAALFIAIALFSVLAAMSEPTWVRIAGFVIAAVVLVRAFASPLGTTALDAAAPILFLTFVALLRGDGAGSLGRCARRLVRQTSGCQGHLPRPRWRLRQCCPAWRTGGSPGS
jgi:hypothetical protein